MHMPESAEAVASMHGPSDADLKGQRTLVLLHRQFQNLIKCLSLEALRSSDPNPLHLQFHIRCEATDTTSPTAPQ